MSFNSPAGGGTAVASKQPPEFPRRKDKRKVKGDCMGGYLITINERFNSLEISFTDKPSEEIRNILKGFKFRWNPKKSVWYGFAEREEIEKALNGEMAEPKSKPKKAQEFDFNVKVGDLFCSSWGYEQTNTTFFQVIALVGKKSVRVREVYPQIINEDATCGMSADRTYKLSNEILPSKEYSVFIKDQENGDLKRLKSYHQDSRNNPQFEVSSFCNAYKYGGETLYESWYY